MLDAETRFAQLYQSHFASVHAYLRRRVGADLADDLSSEVFTTVWRKLDTVPPAEEALPWMYRVAHLTTSNHWRSSRRKRALQDKLASAGVKKLEGVDDQVIVRAEVRDALELLSQLRPADEEILKLSLWEQLDPTEISQVLDITPEAARQRLHRARQRLAALYDKKQDADNPPLLGKEVSGEH